jgi:type VI protein secretion system component VasF
MYYFWLKTFQTELNGGCKIYKVITKMKRHLAPFLIILSVLLVIIILYFLGKCYHKKELYRTPNDLLQYPNFITT